MLINSVSLWRDYSLNFNTKGPAAGLYRSVIAEMQQLTAHATDVILISRLC
jgi:hypothetical protein